MKLDRNFGAFLNRKRKEKHITMLELGQKLDFTVPYLCDIEKNRRNPPEFSKLEQIAEILELTDGERTTMFDLAGEDRNTIAPDLPVYIMNRDYVATALRTARDMGAGEAEWNRFIEDLKKREG